MRVCDNCGFRIQAKQGKLIDRVMNEMFNYGGMAATRAEIIRDLKKIGASEQQVDTYMMGVERGGALTPDQIKRMPRFRP